MMQKALLESGCDGLQKRFMREAAGCTVSCVEFDVAKSPVSMHTPLTRLAGFLATTLQQFGLTYDSQEFPAKEKPSLQELIEPTLRTLVMVAQVLWSVALSVTRSVLHYLLYICFLTKEKDSIYP